MIVSNFQGWKYWQNKILWRKWEFKEKSSYCKISVKQDLLYVLFVQIHSINIKILFWFYHTLHLTFEEPEKSLLTLLAKIKCEDLKWLSFLSFKIVGIFLRKLPHNLIWVYFQIYTSKLHVKKINSNVNHFFLTQIHVFIHYLILRTPFILIIFMAFSAQ